MMPLRTLLMGLTALWLEACSSTSGLGQPSLYRSSNQQKVIGHDQSVVITNVVNEAEALPFAEQYCKKRGRAVRFDRMETLTYHHLASSSASFSCVPGPE